MVTQIKELCEKNNTTIKSLEKELGFGNGTIRRWDERIPSMDRVMKVAEYFNVSVSEITGEKEKPADQKADGNSEDAILFAAYKAAPENVQEAIRNLLGLK